MTGRIFVDSNILVYSVSDDPVKAVKADTILIERIEDIVRDFIVSFTCLGVESSTIFYALELQSNYLLSYYDSLIVASALEASCDVLLTEDMQHGLTINDKLVVENPFLNK